MTRPSEDRAIRHVPDFPKAGILFSTSTTLLRDPEGFKVAIDLMTSPFAAAASISSSASRAEDSFSAARWPIGSTPASCLSASWGSCRRRPSAPSYALEYGTDSLEMHRDAIVPGQRVLIVDDLLATGGTASATVQLVKELGGSYRPRVPDRAGRAEWTRSSKESSCTPSCPTDALR